MSTAPTPRVPEVLGRYTVNGVDRVLYGRRNDTGELWINDEPATHRHGPVSDVYLVEVLKPSEQGAPAEALVEDYLAQAGKHGKIPAAPTPFVLNLLAAA
jgi:hypothetical protein